MGELHDDLARRVRTCAELREIDRVDPACADPAKSRRKAVHLTANAESRRCGKERERGDDETERGADDSQPEEIGDRRGRQEDRADEIGEARRATVFDRTFADARLENFEIEETRQAVAAAECETDRQLGPEDPEDRPPPG